MKESLSFKWRGYGVARLIDRKGKVVYEARLKNIRLESGFGYALDVLMNIDGAAARPFNAIAVGTDNTAPSTVQEGLLNRVAVQVLTPGVNIVRNGKSIRIDGLFDYDQANADLWEWGVYAYYPNDGVDVALNRALFSDVIPKNNEVQLTIEAYLDWA